MDIKQGGRITPYGFACGYIERKGDGDNRAMLEMEHGIYHVKGFRDGVHFWQSFRAIGDARAFYRIALKPKVTGE